MIHMCSQHCLFHNSAAVEDAIERIDTVETTNHSDTEPQFITAVVGYMPMTNELLEDQVDMTAMLHSLHMSTVASSAIERHKKPSNSKRKRAWLRGYYAALKDFDEGTLAIEDGQIVSRLSW